MVTVTDYDWRVSVRVTGVRNGWNTTLVDTPTFELRSNAQFGGIWNDADTVARVARGMFTTLLQPGDQTHVTVTGIDTGATSFATFTQH